MKKKLVILGTGQQAKVLADELIFLKKVKLIGFFKIDKTKKKNIIVNSRKIPIFTDFKKITNNYFIIALGNNHLIKLIKKKIEKYKKKFKWYTHVSSKSLISKNVRIGKGSIIMKGSIINSNSKIGEHCLVNTGSIIEHDNILEDFSSVGPGAITSGSVSLGSYSHLGTGSVVMNNIKIEKNTIIGIGSVVLKNCKKNSTYFGNPAKFIKNRNAKDKYM
jgi:acetyltransferase EpsM